MPYITQEKRPKYNRVIEKLNEDFLFDKEIIYILYEYCSQYIKPSYNNYKNFCGELRQCAKEIERRTGATELIVTGVSVDIDDLSSERKNICQSKVKFMSQSDIQVNGDLNYILYGYCKRYVTYEYSDFARDLRLTANKITEEILAPYEDIKIEENGDVF